MDLQIIQNRIFEVRGSRIMLDFHLAELYQVETRALKQAVKRNISRFPPRTLLFNSRERNGRDLSQVVISSPKTSGIHQRHQWHFVSRVWRCFHLSCVLKSQYR